MRRIAEPGGGDRQRQRHGETDGDRLRPAAIGGGERLGVPQPARLLLLALAPPLRLGGGPGVLALAARAEIGAIDFVETGGDVGTSTETLSLFQPQAAVRQPRVLAIMSAPFGGGAAHALEADQQVTVAREPLRQLRPNAEQSLVRDLDMGAVVVGALDQQPRVDQPVDQTARGGRQVVEPRAKTPRSSSSRTRPGVNAWRSASSSASVAPPIVSSARRRTADSKGERSSSRIAS